MKNKDTNAIAERYQSVLLQEEMYDCIRDYMSEGMSYAEAKRECSGRGYEEDATVEEQPEQPQGINPHDLDLNSIKKLLHPGEASEPYFTDHVLPRHNAYVTGETDYVDPEQWMDTEWPQIAKIENYLDNIKHGRVGNLARKVGTAVQKGTRNLGRKLKTFKPRFQSPVSFPGRR